MAITLFMLVWIWIVDSIWLLTVPALMLSLRSTYTFPRVSIAAALSISGLAFLVTFVFWSLTASSFEVAAFTASRAALTSLVVVRSYLGADRVLNTVTIWMPVLRTGLFFFSRWLSSVIEILDDIRYAYSLESQRGVLPRWKLILFAFGAATLELVDLIERLLLVVFARGRYPNLRIWFTPWPLSRKIVICDSALMLAVLGGSRLAVMQELVASASVHLPL